VSEELLERVRTVLGDAVVDGHAHCGDATVLVPTERIVEVLRTLRDDEGLQFNFLMDLTAVDYLGREPRFEVVYHLASIEEQPRASYPSKLYHRLRVKIGVPEAKCEAPSVVDVWPAANWMEREAWDLYGIRFVGHPDLRRILLYDQFEGHPLRKDYPKERRQPLVGQRN
jgi:NADH-quinone oxidoreductase subunit C